MQWGCPVLTAENFDARTMALALPRILIEQINVLPIQVVGGRVLYVGFPERPVAAASFALERMSGLHVESDH